ncbi:hypothetical protein [Cyanobium sp. NIES-981]|uniref:hypothetical protein n=1 Tax=Cyanobium sp. NIES-981 TaxID=1851505 RepID=UPI0012FCD83E|nr:hypothetical protein [Cyanobium sp. NIES-981]
MKLHVFGARSLAGAAFADLAAQWAGGSGLQLYARQQHGYAALDLAQAEGLALNPDEPALGLVSFAPLWLFAPFLKRWLTRQPHAAGCLAAVVACSSSSALTKRFASNGSDRSLAACLSQAEDDLLTTCRHYGIPCGILQPTLIYGQVGSQRDRNLSRLVGMMRRWPLVPVPSRTGLRQPIHAFQLAAVALHLTQRLAAAGSGAGLPERLAVGGDQALTYRAMLEGLQQALPAHHPARRCRLLPIPNRLFFLLSAPLLLGSPRAFEAVLRLAADLAGFTPSHELLGRPAEPFPRWPLAL